MELYYVILNNETEYECSVPGDANLYGPPAVTVRGFIGGVGTLWERWGKLRWPEIVAPSEQLLEEGFRYGPTAAAIGRRIEILRRFEATARHLMLERTPPEADDVWHRPGLETTLRRLSEHGWRDIYSGKLGRLIGGYVQEAGGVLTAEDMAGYSPQVEQAYAISSRGHPVFALCCQLAH